MKYLCLICTEKVIEQMSEAVAEQHFQEYAEFTDAIRASGHTLAVTGFCHPAQLLRSEYGMPDHDNGWALRRNQRAAWRLLSYRNSRSERGHPGGFKDSGG